jgi:putative ATPase
MNLFNTDLFENIRSERAPLAERMRARDLGEFIGQTHLINPNSLLSRAIRAGMLGSSIFYGPPGTGKTTLASIIANQTGSRYVYLNAVSSGVADAKKVIEDAKNALSLYGKRTYLLLDECHRWNKAQSDSVLAAIEKGEIIFIGSTTENPYVSMTRAIVSRCRIFEFKPLTSAEVLTGVKRAVSNKERGLGNFNLQIDDEVLNHFAFQSNGDLRSALNALELSTLSTTPSADGSIKIDIKTAEEASKTRALSVDENLYYDLLSCFGKSLRGSDPDAAVYYSLRLIAAGCDPLIVLRRLIAHSAEDVGLADPRALQIAVSALTAYEKMGLPEGKIPLTQAVIYTALAPKSNSVVNAIALAEEAVALAEDQSIPPYLRDQSYNPVKDSNYKYPHDFGGYVKQQYLPDAIKDRKFYFPSVNGEEMVYNGKDKPKTKGE